VGALGAALGLVGELPGSGWGLGLLLAPVAAWFWFLRGYALSAWHGCPLWKGLLATVLNVVLALGMFLLLLASAGLLVLVLAS
jgi:hypothetical protein